METRANEPPRVRQKQFTYNTAVRWTGEKIGVLSSDKKADVTVSSPPEFKGTPGLWTPEDMFVGALETCQFLTFLALAKRRNIKIMSYSSTASGDLELVNGGFRFTRVVISPVIMVEDPAAEEEVLALAHQAHKTCLVANSVTATMEIHPRVLVEVPEAAPPSV
jgi:organic hydroperoxide reductase OsmC/OhrA